MKKQIKQYGGSLIIGLDKEDKKFFDIDEGDWVDIEICKIPKPLPVVSSEEEMITKTKEAVNQTAIPTQTKFKEAKQNGKNN